jgi:hypothetical protein
VDDPYQTLASLPSLQGYSKKDQYHDFRQLFMGTEQGKKVFAQILEWGHLLRPSSSGKPIDPYLTHVHDGESNIARKLLVTVINEPPEPQAKQQSKPKR